MLVFYLAALLTCAYAQSSSCSYSDPSGYSLTWNVNNGQVNFNLTYRNFPTNSYTGVGFGDSMSAGIDAILVSVSGSQVQVNNGMMSGYNPPNLINDRTVTTQSSSYINRVLSAQFSRPLSLTSNNHKSLTGCTTWDFITTPGGFNNGQYTKHQNQPKQQQICNIDTSCRQGSQGLMNMLSPNQKQGNNNNRNNNNIYSTTTSYNNQAYPLNNQGYNGQNNNNFNGYNGIQYQPTGQMNGQYPPSPMGQGQSYGYMQNTATPPPSGQTYTGAPFQYATTMNPTYGNSGNYGQNNMQFMQSPQGNQPQGMYNGYQSNQPGSNQYNNQMQYPPGQGSAPSSQRLNDPYQQPYGLGQGAQSSYIPNQMAYSSNANSQAGNQRMFDPSSQETYQGYYSSGPNQQQQQPMYQAPYSSQNYGRKRRSIRAKRQTPGYQPTNNIYGYDYSNNLGASASTTAPIVVNPNYKYLSGPLADEYSRTYAQEVRAYDQQTAGFSNSGGQNLNGNAPVLSNTQQNQANYQQIQQDYVRNPNPQAGQTYTNNIYGYNYGGSTPAPTNYYTQSNSQYYTSTNNVQRDPSNNNNLFYPANPYATTTSPVVGRQFDPSQQNFNGVYQSGSNLKETKLRDPTQYQYDYTNGIARDYVPGTSVQTPFEYTYYDPRTSLFYPYRTSSNFQPFNSTYYDDYGVVHSSSSTFLATSSPNTNSRFFYDPRSSGQGSVGLNTCAQQDPYWCDYYVKIFLSSQQQLNYSTQQMACQQLRASLTDSYNGCCNTVRTAGC